jgi:xylulokinase
VTFVPYLAGERSPFMTPDARGVFAGLSLAHGRAHMVRAVVEGTIFALADTLDVMTPLARAERLLATGGGARSDLWLGVARSVLGVPLVRPAEEGSPARGAAILALVGAEVYPDVASAIAATAPDTTDVAVPDGPYDAAVRARYREASAWARGRA